jgi:hypothetical protein
MSWVLNLQPDLILGGSILSLTQDILHHHQIKGLVLDVDETLVPFNSSEASEELMEWVAEIRQVASLWLVSNNLSENRIGNIARSLNLPYIFGAAKPSRRKLKEAADAMSLPVERVAMVGDRLFTDVLAGNRLGMFTILVELMLDPSKTEVFSPIRDFEVRFSQLLGISLSGKQQNFTKHNKSK